MWLRRGARRLAVVQLYPRLFSVQRRLLLLMRVIAPRGVL
jgi:hypothetical protein